MSNENRPEQDQPDNNPERTITPSFLARAIAKRRIKESKKEEFGLGMVIGGQPSPASPFGEQVRLAHTALIIETAIRYPSTIKLSSDFFNILFDGMSDEACEMFLSSSGINTTVGGQKINPTKVREIVRGIYEGVVSLSPSINLDDSSKQINEARKMGKELSLPPESIYEDDKLFEDLIRRTSSPEKTAIKALEDLDLTTAEKFGEVFINLLIRFMNVFKEDMDEEVQSQEQKIMKDIIAGLEIKTKIQERFLERKRTRINLLKENISRFWGESAFDNLPKDLRIRIAQHTDPEIKS